MIEGRFCRGECGTELADLRKTHCKPCGDRERASRALCMAGISEPDADTLEHARLVASMYAHAEDVAYIIRVRAGTANVF